MRSRILLDSYLASNFGDDLLVSLLGRRYPEQDFYLMCDHSYLPRLGPRSNLHALGAASPPTAPVLRRTQDKARLITRRPRARFAELVSEGQFDAYVLFGGSLFIEGRGVTRRGREAELSFAAENIPVSGILNCNFGPFRSTGYLKRHEQLFSRMDFVSFRDSASLRLFDHLKQATYGADIAFSLAGTFPFSSPQTNSPRGPRDEVMSILPIYPAGRKALSAHHETYLGILEQLASAHLKKEHSRVELIPCCVAEGDARACEELLRRLSSARDRVSIAEASSVNQVVQQIASSVCVVASRFHAICVALVTGRPVVALSYSGKIRAALRDLGLERNCVDIDGLATVDLPDLAPLERTSSSTMRMTTFERQFEHFERALRIRPFNGRAGGQNDGLEGSGEWPV